MPRKRKDTFALILSIFKIMIEIQAVTKYQRSHSSLLRSYCGDKYDCLKKTHLSDLEVTYIHTAVQLAERLTLWPPTTVTRFDPGWAYGMVSGHQVRQLGFSVRSISPHSNTSETPREISHSFNLIIIAVKK